MSIAPKKRALAVVEEQRLRHAEESDDRMGLVMVLTRIARCRTDNGRPLAAETARQIAREALIERGLRW